MFKTLKNFFFIISICIVFLVFPLKHVVYAADCPGDCKSYQACSGSGRCDGRYGCTDFNAPCCCITLTTTSDSISIFSEGAEWLFGEDSLILNLVRPPTLFNMEGTASIASIGIFIVSFLWWILIVATFAAGAIGAMKWVSSGGEESKVQSAKKWTVNAVTGFGVAIAIFLIANFFTWILKMGNVFDLAQNLAVCGEGENTVTLIDWKKDNNNLDAKECKCNGGWSCSK